MAAPEGLAQGMGPFGQGPIPTGPVRGCGTGQQNVPPLAIAELPRVTIGILDGYFLPSEVTVAPGTVVVWVNQGGLPHTTTAWNRWDSGALRPGEACAAWFVTPGTYPYLSIVAADQGMMIGTVSVEGAPVGSGAGSPAPGMSPGGAPGAY
jgi:hypothetical protein